MLLESETQVRVLYAGKPWFISLLAQWIEQWFPKPLVGGSIPLGGTKDKKMSTEKLNRLKRLLKEESSWTACGSGRGTKCRQQKKARQHIRRLEKLTRLIKEAVVQ